MKRNLIVLFALLMACGCAPYLRSFTETTHVVADFGADQLRAGGLAVLPVVAGDDEQHLRLPFAEEVDRHLSEAVPGGRAVPIRDAMEIVRSHELEATVLDALTSYRSFSMFNKEDLQRLKEPLGVRYALYCELQKYTAERTPMEPFRGIADIVDVRMTALVLDLHTGEILQEIRGQVHSRAAIAANELPLQRYAESLATSVLAELPGSQVEIVQSVDRATVSGPNTGALAD